MYDHVERIDEIVHNLDEVIEGLKKELHSLKTMPIITKMTSIRMGLMECYIEFCRLESE